MDEPQSIDLDLERRRIVDAACDVWIRRLIDYSRANSLLFYRPLKVGTLDLTAETEAVGHLLAGDKLTVEALTSVGRYSESPDPVVVRARHEAERRQKARSALVALQRKALSNLEEKGIETLHLAMGLATWPAADGGRPYDAPVLLLPARIEARGRAGDDLRLSVVGEPHVNPVLLYVLEEHYAIHINASVVLSECGGEDEAGQWRIDPEKVFERIERATTSVPGFRITQRVIVANFQFTKMAMVEDLKKNGATIASSAIVAAIAGHRLSRQKLAQAAVNIELAQLDERPVSDDYLVLDADSTQHRAIVLVARGQNGVIQGPPGTGKSQTISNLIAQSIAEGRRVLFVAEKRAALDAVIKRLSHPDVGLGHLVLDLHGASVSRREVMARLAYTLEQIRHTPSVDGAEAVHRECEAWRKLLNEHARRVNSIRQPTGLSVYQMVGRLLRLPAAAKSALRLRGETLVALTAERVAAVNQWILESAANGTLFLGIDPSPWNNADIKDGQRAQAALDLATKAANELWPEFERRLQQVATQLGVRPPSTLGETASFLAVLCDARSIRQRYRTELFSSQPGDLARALEPAKGGRIARSWAFLWNATYQDARKRLLELREAPASTSLLRQEALQAEDVLRRWQALAPASPTPVEADAEIELIAAFSALNEAIKNLGAMTEAGLFDDLQLSEVASWLRTLATDRQTPFRLPGMYNLRSRFAEAGLGGFVDDLRKHRVAAEHWLARFEYIWLSSALEHVFASDPALASFNSRAHEQVIEQFRRLDRERVRLAAQRVRRLHAERAIEAMNRHFDQADLVRKEAAKKARHIPLRELLARAPDVLMRIAPCWVASPLSVSQLLDGGKRHFDIVIFDEASQILQEEAIPALYRAEQVVVAGDRHQLPPTTFFVTAIEGEDEILDDGDEVRSVGVTAAIGGFESLLDTLQAFLPNWLLEWHYRSEDERLITFSNTYVYAGRLVTFPSARGHEAIRHILVPHDSSLGGQEESASREVEEVVRQVILHAETRPHESLGVITMGIKHANRIQSALDHALDRRPDLADFFSLDRQERFFVKNLETVQGDERDAIILSIGYGRAANGDLPHRFGPLAQDVGYRRLNVAITRAKRRMCVISSFSHDEIDLDRSGGRGVQLLKAFLAYAASGGTRLSDDERAGESSLNAFEADVHDALEAHGIKTRPQFGASRYRIDLVAMHPKKPGRPVLAIECDGASYHSSATARDRDRLRQEHLQRLGWRFHCIWSTDWFYHREQEIARAISAYREAVLWADSLDADLGPAQAASWSQPKRQAQQQPVARPRGPRPHVPVRETIDQYSDRELLQIAEWVTSDGLLRTDEELIREIFETLPFERLGSRIRKRLKTVVEIVRRHQGTATVP
ncbi:AAA domain-containing protein [Kallotenue papyrolyticum]|uniref:AAA domain-containing protein n=1 Tax=Kallotenue papyrolyticum TaxID=1325125 RepID=UPI0004B9CD92|nr:AAA domain-containing protein [Kallotenue papyrolyticum]